MKNTQLEAQGCTKNIKVILSLVPIFVILLIANVSAFDFDNVKSYNQTSKEITITNAFGYGSVLATYKLMYNTDECLTDCYAIIGVKLNTENKLMDQIKLYNKLDRATTITKINTYIETTKTIQEEKPIFERSCLTKEINKTLTEVCSEIQTGTRLIDKNITSYNLYDGGSLQAGVYYFRIEGKKNPRESIDWVINVFGEDLKEWAWWNSNWGKKKEIQIATKSGVALSDYQIRLNITYNANMQSDYDDLRFINALETAELYYYIWNYSSSYVYVDVRGNWTTGSNTSIYMYYNNPTATTTSSGADTYYYFNDFESDVLGSKPLGWYDYNSPNDQMNVIGTTGQSYHGSQFWNINDTSGSNPYGGGNNTLATYANGKYMFYAKRFSGTNNVQTFVVWTATGSGGNQCFNIPVNSSGSTYVEHEFAWNSSDVMRYKNDMNISTTFGTFVTSGDCGAFMQSSFSSGISNYFIDQFAFANFTFPEPIYNFGAEGSAPNTAVYLNTPIINYNSTTSPITFNCSATAEGGILNITLIFDTINNLTISPTAGQNGSLQTSLGITEGSHTWNCVAYDNSLNAGQNTSRAITIDKTAPFVKLVSPARNTEYFINTPNQSVQFNLSIIETGVGLQKCIYYNGTINGSITCGTNATLTFTEGDYWLRFWANDTLGQTGYNETTFSVNTYNYTTEYTTPVFEGDNHTIYLNLSANNLTYSSANVTYEGVVYTLTGTSVNSTLVRYSKILTAPYVTANANNNLSFQMMFNSNRTTTLNFSQLVIAIPNLTITSSPCTDLALNFTLYDEENLSQINGTMEYNFIYGGTSNSSQVRVYGKIDSTYSLYLCVNASLSTNWTMGSGQIFYRSPSYVDRRYYLFNNTYIYNNSREILLYDLYTADQTSFQLDIEDTSLNPYVSRYTTLNRWYNDLNEYKVVDVGFTDETGSTIIHVKTEDIDYRIGVYEQNGTLIKLANPIRMVCLTSPCTYTLKISPSETDYTSFLGVDYLFTFNETSNIWTFTYSDTTGNTQYMNLSVYKLQGNSYTSVCSSLGSGSAGSIVCNTTGQTGTLKGEVTRSASPFIVIAQKLVNIGSDALKSSWGLWLSMILVIPIIFVFAFMSPIGMVIGAVIALIPAFYFGSINLAIIGGVAVLGGIVLHFVKRVG